MDLSMTLFGTINLFFLVGGIGILILLAIVLLKANRALDIWLRKNSW